MVLMVKRVQPVSLTHAYFGGILLESVANRMVDPVPPPLSKEANQLDTVGLAQPPECGLEIGPDTWGDPMGEGTPL